MLFILSGPVHSGKTTRLKKMVSELKKKRIHFDGFLSQPNIKNNEITGYNLLDLKEKTAIPFITKTGKPHWEKIGPFFFIPRSLKRAKGIILRAKGSDLIIIDEVGPLELANQGLWPALEAILYPLEKDILLVIRENILEEFLKRVDEKNVTLFHNRQDDIFPEIVAALKKNMIK